MPDGYVNRANVRVIIGLYKEAIADYDRALHLASPGWMHRVRVERLRREAMEKWRRSKKKDN